MNLRRKIMKKALPYLLATLLIIAIGTNLITVQYLLKVKNNLESADKEIKLYQKIHEIPFVNETVQIANKEIKINENQKYYLVGGDCSEIVKEGLNYKNLISYDLKESFKGTTEMIIQEEDVYYTILLRTTINQSGYSNNNFEMTDASGFSKESYSTMYEIHLTCQNLDK
jgi:hypothetical protein